MFTVTVLLCLAGQEPKECLPPTAQMSFRLEDKVATEVWCGLEGQAYAAQLPYADDPTLYSKVLCEREGHNGGQR